MKNLELTLENVDQVISWFKANPDKTKLRVIDDIIRNYDAKRESAKIATYLIQPKMWNWLTKDYLKHNSATQQSANLATQLNFTPISQFKPTMKRNIETLDPSWSIATQIDYYKTRGWKIPNRLQQYKHAPNIKRDKASTFEDVFGEISQILKQETEKPKTSIQWAQEDDF